MSYTDETGYKWESEGAAHFHSLLVRGAEWLERPHIAPQTAPEASCAYCASIITGNRCESCGAPRRAEKRDVELYRAWQELANCQSTPIVFPECLHPEVI